MTTRAERLYKDALDLPINDRMQLIDKLLQNTNLPSQLELDQVWSNEVERRYREVENGIVELIPGEEVLKKVKSKLK
jgi:putative addiction module component (TIGR02574 family)